MAIEHPFQALFETFGRLPAVHAESVNRAAYEQLWDLLAVSPEQPGRCILLRSPRAGHGKTHLLSRLQHNLGVGHEFIPLHAANGSHIDAATVTGDTLARLGRSLPAGGGLTVLDMLIRRLFATALQPLVRSGEVPCQDREGALSALRNRPIETFDFQHPNAVTAHWAKENFEVLGPRLALELAQRSGAPLRDVMFWVDALFRFAATPIEMPTRTGTLIQSVAAGDLAAAQVFDRLAALLGLLSQLVRVVLVADDLEGFSADESAALRLAAFLGSLRHSAERVDAIVSINRDVWESAFLPRLSAGLADRLAEVVVELAPLGRDETVALLDARAPGLGERVYDRIDFSNGERHARGIIRAAGDAWTHAARQVRFPNEEAPTKAEASAPVLAAEPVPQVAKECPLFEEPDHSPVATVAPQSAVAVAIAAAAAEVQEEEEAPQTTAPVVAQPAPVAANEPVAEQPPLVTPPPVVPEPPPVAWSFPNPEPAAAEIEPVLVGKLVEEVAPPILPVFNPPAAAAAVPVLTPEPESAFVATPATSPSPQSGFIQTPAFRQETPLSEVLASEAAADPEPVVWPAIHVPPAGSSGASPFQIPTTPEPPVAKLIEPEPVVAAPTFATPAPPASPAHAAPVYGFAPTVFEKPVEPVAHANVYGNAAETPATVPQAVAETPPAVSVTSSPETDRVDELLRQFRERYARG